MNEPLCMELIFNRAALSFKEFSPRFTGEFPQCREDMAYRDQSDPYYTIQSVGFIGAAVYVFPPIIKSFDHGNNLIMPDSVFRPNLIVAAEHIVIPLYRHNAVQDKLPVLPLVEGDIVFF